MHGREEHLGPAGLPLARIKRLKLPAYLYSAHSAGEIVLLENSTEVRVPPPAGNISTVPSRVFTRVQHLETLLVLEFIQSSPPHSFKFIGFPSRRLPFLNYTLTRLSCLRKIVTQSFPVNRFPVDRPGAAFNARGAP